MRGIRGAVSVSERLSGISPAHAGNTCANLPGNNSIEDQPRTCGEYICTICAGSMAIGSAPHMRGIRLTAKSETCLLWISPAHAGNTSIIDPGCTRYTDQPRTCGEYWRDRFRSMANQGSAPHMRGIRDAHSVSERLSGISPAHAGNTATATAQDVVRADQPRTCGEYKRECSIVPAMTGSAPHMRGIPSRRFVKRQQNWISPAHAGNTWALANQGYIYRDQPRTCGEYVKSLQFLGGHAGSAPHMRGILVTGFDPDSCTGISPAHAGNTTSGYPAATAGPDQPRTCGEYRTGQIPTDMTWGSAPHMRGIQESETHPRSLARISPAHAGNTIQ